MTKFENHNMIQLHGNCLNTILVLTSYCASSKLPFHIMIVMIHRRIPVIEEKNVKSAKRKKKKLWKILKKTKLFRETIPDLPD